MTITKVTDHAVQALDAVLSQFDDSARLRKLVEFVGDQVQLLENVIWQVYENSLLDNATGLILGEYGKILDELRGSLGDDDYRRVMQVVLAAYQSNGTAPEIIYLASELLGVDVWYQQRGRASYKLSYEITTPLSGDQLERCRRILEIIRPAGVEHCVVESKASGPAFKLDSATAGLDNGLLGRRII